MWMDFFRSWNKGLGIGAVLLGAGLLSPAGVGAQATPQTALDRQLEKVDVAVSGVGEFTKSVRGTNYQGFTFSADPSTTVGALVTVRYTAKPLLGFEFNYGYARYTERYTDYTPSLPVVDQNGNSSGYLSGNGAQTKATEATFGYVAHGPTVFGYRSFASGGVGSLIFTPTTYGGQGLPQQIRPLYYYDVGLEGNVLGSSHFGVRAQLRQKFFTAPDFGQNYLQIRKTTFTTEPGIGFFVRF